MRTTPALRTLAAALLSGGVLTVAAAGTSMAAAPSAPASGGGGSDGPVWGTVVSGGELNVRLQPSTTSPVVAALSPGSQDRVQCAVSGQSVFGDTTWYWLVGAHAWASAAFVDTGGHWVPSCSDPCPGEKDGVWHNAHWDHNDRDLSQDPGWSSNGNGSWSFSVSSSWTWTVSGSGSGSSPSSWDWVPGGR
ncbi:SH3 domain-containing protein [Streptomyces sp. NBC_01558]|uniref:SH3 domain-containing protein n=1 Tax=unclassified Streptomyces TaxID=2593676 RepID=UPI002DDBD825|nr:MULTISPECIES: SH3 domain-containing protein [unclassified Streptomyces]WSD78602.1 SH3 domain-containing protein [Streptomyces sp. NBC_01558]